MLKHRTPPSRHHHAPFPRSGQDDRQRQLEKDNNRLMTSLDLLHEGAISALAEKQLQIDTMQSSLQERDDPRHLEEELVELRRERAELQDEIHDLEDTLHQERESY